MSSLRIEIDENSYTWQLSRMELPAKTKLEQCIEMTQRKKETWSDAVDRWSKTTGLSRSTVYRLMQLGKTNNLRTAVTVQRATNGQILSEEWL